MQLQMPKVIKLLGNNSRVQPWFSIAQFLPTLNNTQYVHGHK